MKKYYAFITEPKLTPILIGEFSDINEAMNNEPPNTIWVMDEQDLSEFTGKCVEIAINNLISQEDLDNLANNKES
jgi:hypothetical protein